MKRGRTVLQAKRYGTHTCTTNMPLRQVAQRMVKEEINTIVVVDADGYLAGIITRLDALRIFLAHDDWADLPVSECMHRDVQVVTPQTLLRDAAQMLLDHQIHQVVVVEYEGEQQRPVAVLSATDLIYHMVKDE